jgi:predicted small secreted protein
MFRHWVVLICLAAFLTAGCSTMGEITGKTVKGVENAADDFKHGYRKGRSE